MWKTAYTEIGKFSGGLLVPAMFNASIKSGTTAICSVVLTVLSAPEGGIACGIVVQAAAFGVSKAGEKIGETSGEVIYNTKK